MSRPRKYQLYCDPVALHNELIKRTATGTTSDQLGQMYLDIIKGIMSRPNFSGYYGEMKEEMEFVAIHNLVKYTHNYNPDYFSSNPNSAFTYCSRIVFQCFTMTITAMKKHQEKENMYQEVIASSLYQELAKEIAENEFYETIGEK